MKRILRAALCLTAAIAAPSGLATAQTVEASVTVISDGPKQTTTTTTCSNGTCVRTVTIVYIN